MESNSFSETVNVFWQTSQTIYLPLEAIGLVALGVLATYAMRRYKTTLAAARTPQTETPVSLPFSLQSTLASASGMAANRVEPAKAVAVPLKAPAHTKGAHQANSTPEPAVA